MAFVLATQVTDCNLTPIDLMPKVCTDHKHWYSAPHNFGALGFMGGLNCIVRVPARNLEEKKHPSIPSTPPAPSSSANELST